MKTTADKTTGLVLEIQRMSTEDGPGLRTTLFMKGCSLACRWCHNPESISAAPQIRWIENRCIGCGDCLKACRQNALTGKGGMIVINRNLCSGCGECAGLCPSSALELWGQKMTASGAYRELIKDRAFFSKSGGVTVSGGEAALQSSFVAELFELLHSEGVHTALDTCGVCTESQLDLSCRNADLILFDLKESDPELHIKYTGGGIDKVQDSFRRVVDIIKTSRLHAQAWPEARAKKMWIRTPIIPGLTDRDENIRALSRFLISDGDGMWDRWELCAFNNLCKDKYLRLGKEWELSNAPLMNKSVMNNLVTAAVDEGIDKDSVVWTGSVNMED